jgi:glycerol kinase
VGPGILAIDQGTSGTKALVVDECGEVLSCAEIPVSLHALGDGGVQQDSRELLESVLAAGRQAIAESSVEVVAAGLANQGETVLAWDGSTGEALSPAISWQDRRSADFVATLAEHEARLTQITGLPLDPYFIAPKLRWLKDRSPSGARVTSLDAWLNWHLIARAVTDVATASRSLVLDLDTRTWSEEAAGIFGLDVAAFPEIVTNAADFGVTNVFGPKLSLNALIVDQQAALLGERCRVRGEAKCTYGTGAFFLVNCGSTPIHSNHRLSASVAWETPDELAYCLDGQVYSAGSAVDWLVRLGLLSSSRELDTVGRDVRSSSLVTCVPSFAGLGAPLWEPRASAHFEGIDLSTTSTDIVWSVLDGIACQVASVVVASESDVGVPLEVLRVDGGLSASQLLMQHQADVLQRPVEVFVSPHATALGVVELVRRGVGLAPLAVDELATGQRFEPRMAASESLERRERWSAAAARAADAARKGVR